VRVPIKDAPVAVGIRDGVLVSSIPNIREHQERSSGCLMIVPQAIELPIKQINFRALNGFPARCGKITFKLGVAQPVPKNSYVCIRGLLCYDEHAR